MGTHHRQWSAAMTSDDARDRVPGMRAADLLRPAFRHAVWNTYDHLGLLVLANLLWLALCLPVVTAPPATAGLFHLTRLLSRGEPGGLRDLVRGFRVHLTPALKLGALDLVATVLLWINVDFYSHLGGFAAIPGMILAAALIWGAAFYLLMHAHLVPLVVGGERSLAQLLKKSALLTLDNLAFTLGITVQAISLTALCVITGAGLVLVGGSLVASLLVAGHRELLRKYADSPGETAPEPETRTWRDLWRPWDSHRHQP
jgi:uncharacterized membrane protein YesL